MASKAKKPQRAVPPNDVCTTIRVPAALMEKIEDAALELQCSRAQAIRRALVRGFDQKKGRHYVTF